MKPQFQCPHCGHQAFSRARFRVNPETGEPVEQPSSLRLVLSLSIPLGILSVWMFVRLGPGSGCGLWTLGTVLAIATPIYLWRQHQAYKQLPESTGQACAGCGRPLETKRTREAEQFSEEGS